MSPPTSTTLLTSPNATRTLTLSDLGPSLRSKYEAYKASREDEREVIPADELYEQICGEGRKELIQSHRLWANPHPPMDPTICTVIPSEDYDPYQFQHHYTSSLVREQNYQRVTEGTADQEIGHHMGDQSVLLEGDPNAKRLSEVEATEKLFQYFGTFPDASEETDGIGFKERFVRMRKDVAQDIKFRQQHGVRTEVHPASFLLSEIDMVFTPHIILPENHSCISREKELIWFSKVSHHAIPYLNHFLKNSATLSDYEISKRGSDITSFCDHVNKELLLAIQKTGRGISEEKFSLTTPMDEVTDLETTRSSNVSPPFLRLEPEEPLPHTQKAHSFDIRSDRKDKARVRVNLYWRDLPHAPDTGSTETTT
ncbi:uncharacterized protein L199_000755 [Kwoniella botswanensis]|uniref:uncharacterized protein n=1 Tax=Kwoniella botswanensis TaxID=1268659 RepID=UPI00315D5268